MPQEKFTEGQLVILNAASNYTDNVVPLVKKIDPRAFSSSLLSLEKRGLVERIAPIGDPKTFILNSATPRCSFKATTAGLTALEVSPDDDAEPAPKEAKAKRGGAVKGEKRAKKAKTPRKVKEPKLDEDGNPIEVEKRGVMLKSFHDEYMANGGGCGDNVDETMREEFTTSSTGKTKNGKDKTVETLNVDELEKWGRKIGLWNDGWSSLNPGMRRMNLSNRVRAAIRKEPGSIKLKGTVLTVPAK